MTEQKINRIRFFSRLIHRVNKRFYVLVIMAAIMCFSNMFAQQIGVKSNILYDATTTMNLGLEVSAAPQWTVDLSVNYNPWVFEGNKKLKHWLIQPEVRYWPCEKFSSHFVGLHTHIGAYNVGGISWFGLESSRYEGNLYGAGISYGYHWILNSRWSLEATLGLGYTYLSQVQYPCEVCMPKVADSEQNYFGPTRIGVSLVYIIK